MKYLKAVSDSLAPSTELRELILAAHADGLLTRDQSDELAKNYGSISIATILSLLTSFPTIIAAITKAIPQLQQVIQQIIDLFKNGPKPNPMPGPTPPDGTVPPVPLSTSLAQGIP